MPSINRKPAKSNQLEPVLFNLPPEVLLQFGTGALLVTLLAGKAIAQTLETIGQASEELFRGERLPIIELPIVTADESESGIADSQS